LCSDDSVEDEHHFMLKCKTFSQHRANLFSSLDFTTIDNLNENETLVFLMSCNRGDIEIASHIIDSVDATFTIRF
jgi:hypothetical protein